MLPRRDALEFQFLLLVSSWFSCWLLLALLVLLQAHSLCFLISESTSQFVDAKVLFS
jgi:hypothetical protein